MDSVINAGNCLIFDSKLLHRSSKMKVNHLDKGIGILDINEQSKLSIYFEVGSFSSSIQFMKSNLHRALIEELDKNDEKYFSDYLRFSSDHYSSDYLKIINKYGKIAELNENERKLSDYIYNNS